MCGSSDKDGDHLLFSVQWGDGSQSGPGDSCGGYAHTYLLPGTYGAMACVTDQHFAPVCHDFQVFATLP